MDVAKEALFGDAGLRASNIKLYPGNDRDSTPQDVAEEVRRALARMAQGDFEAVDNFDD